jgi:hypothetical protein
MDELFIRNKRARAGFKYRRRLRRDGVWSECDKVENLVAQGAGVGQLVGRNNQRGIAPDI